MRTRSFDTDKAILYLVATPIGNLKDMSFRAIEVLNSVDKIYAEDTRTSHVLLSHYDIHTKLESYHEFNQDLKSNQILDELKSGMKLAIISDAGLPVISDPGYKLVSLAVEHQIAVSTIPGASAGISALIASGIAPMPFTFFGFLDAKHMKRVKELEDLKYIAHRVQKLLYFRSILITLEVKVMQGGIIAFKSINPAGVVWRNDEQPAFFLHFIGLFYSRIVGFCAVSESMGRFGIMNHQK